MANLTTITLLLLATIATSSAATAPAPTTTYVNHTVGGPIGWFFNSTSNTSFTNYSSWAASQTFNLGDYLVFNTENQTVIETQNATAYHLCTSDDTSDESTFVWGDDTPGKKTIVVPLVTEGANYYFSDNSDGEQCQQYVARTPPTTECRSVRRFPTRRHGPTRRPTRHVACPRSQTFPTRLRHVDHLSTRLRHGFDTPHHHF